MTMMRTSKKLVRETVIKLVFCSLHFIVRFDIQRRMERILIIVFPILIPTVVVVCL